MYEEPRARRGKKRKRKKADLTNTLGNSIYATINKTQDTSGFHEEAWSERKDLDNVQESGRYGALVKKSQTVCQLIWWLTFRTQGKDAKQSWPLSKQRLGNSLLNSKQERFCLVSRSVRSPEITAPRLIYSTISQCTLVFWAVAPTAKCRELYKCFKYISSASQTVSVSNPVLLHTLSTGSAFHTERKESSPRCSVTAGAMRFCPLPPHFLFTLSWEMKPGGGGINDSSKLPVMQAIPFLQSTCFKTVKVNIITLM